MPAHNRDTANLEHKLKLAATLMMSHGSEHGAIGADGTYSMPQSSKDIRKKVREARRICVGGCERLESKELPFKMCSNCQAIFYCSRQCQKNDWPKHKEFCSESQRQKRLQKLTTTLLVNINFMAYLKIAIVLKFGLLNSPVSEPFSALVHLLIEPENIVDFARLRGELEPSPKGREKFKGMLQVNAVVPCSGHYHLAEEKLHALWKAKRAEADATGPTYAAGVVGVVVIALGTSTTTMEIPIVIPSDLLAIAKVAQPFSQIFPAPPITFRQVPLAFDTCIEYINTSIRTDTDNRYLLRTDMTPADEEIIRDSAINSDQEHGFLKKRMRVEYIYQVLLGLANVPFDDGRVL